MISLPDPTLLERLHQAAEFARRKRFVAAPIDLKDLDEAIRLLEANAGAGAVSNPPADAGKSEDATA